MLEPPAVENYSREPCTATETWRWLLEIVRSAGRNHCTGREQVGVPGKVPPGLPATAQLLSECAGILEEFVLLSAAESSS